jgi:aryl-alcohol dehydrogenase-like predicted oxidoreductase
LPEISSVIIGATKSSQIEDNIKATTISLPQDAIKRIDDILSVGSVRS